MRLCFYLLIVQFSDYFQCSKFSTIQKAIRFLFRKAVQLFLLFFRLVDESEMSVFKLPLSEICALFQPDNIRQGDSIKKLKEWGHIDALQQHFKTNFKRGLNHEDKDHDTRIKVYGDNQAIIKPPKTIWELIMENFEDQMLRILCAAAIVSLVLGIATEGLADGWMEGASIIIAVVIIVTVTSGNNYIKEQQFQKLNAIATAKNVNVYRSGNIEHLSVYELMVGDIVEIETGQILSVDGILIEGSNLSIDESSLTGQAKQIKKTVPVTYEPIENANPFLISSSRVLQGTGLMVVAAVGRNSYYGKLKIKIQQDVDETPLQIKLSALAQQVGHVGMVSAAATFLAMFIHYLFDCYHEQDFLKMFLSTQTLHEIIDYFIIAVSIVVVAVPEGLPLSVTIALAYSVGKMKEQNNLVRFLQACQTMGGADNICSDKTGTLTKNLMTVTKLYVEERNNQIITREGMTENTAKLMCISICNNSNANPRIEQTRDSLFIEQIGNKTECALLQTAYRLGFDYKKFRSKQKILKVFPFSSSRKKMATIYQDDSGSKFVFVKGAPDFLIPFCNRYINAEGSQSKMTNEFNDTLIDVVQEYASQSLRTILLAFKQIHNVPAEWEQIQRDLVVLGLIGIKDPLRNGIAEAVAACHDAGVRVRMVTGDNKKTAIAIAKQAGILSQEWFERDQDCTVMEGKQFREFVGGLVNQGTQEETVGDLQNFKKVRNQLCVLARSSPQDKYLMAVGLKKLDHVVAMTGDGTNDAPALKKADIGFAMGIAGTQVAKQASGIILLDDNFSSIVTAMKWGRNIFDSIRKFLQFQLTVNFVALVMAFVGGAVLRESPLNPIQMLWVNLIMDTLASLALATEPPSDQLLKRKPYSRREGLITSNMWKFIIFQGLTQILILGTILFKGPQLLGISSSIGVTQWNQQTGKHYSIFFNVFVLLQVFNEINARKLKSNEFNVFQNFFNNRLFLFILVTTILIQLFMVRYGGKSLKTIELSFKQNLLCMVLGSTSLLSGLLFKVILPEKISFDRQGIVWGKFKLMFHPSNAPKNYAAINRSMSRSE